MKHQRLRIVATIEFPPGFKDDYGIIISTFKDTVMTALRAEHHKKFGPLEWPAEISCIARWSLEAEEVVV